MKTQYKIGDKVIIKDTNGAFTQHSNIVGTFKQDGVTLYKVNDAGSYTAGEMLPDTFEVSFYNAKHFTPEIMSSFERAIEKLRSAYPDFSSNLSYQEAISNLGKAAMYADEALITEDAAKVHELLGWVGICNYKSGMYLDTSSLNAELAKRKLAKGGQVAKGGTVIKPGGKPTFLTKKHVGKYADGGEVTKQANLVEFESMYDGRVQAYESITQPELYFYVSDGGGHFIVIAEAKGHPATEAFDDWLGDKDAAMKIAKMLAENKDLSEERYADGGTVFNREPWHDKILPLQYITGAICAANGQTVVKMNREAGTTPLSPVERDEMAKQIISIYNERYFGDKRFKKNKFAKGGTIMARGGETRLTRGFIAFPYRKKFVLVDEATQSLWANEYFDSAKEVIDFAKQNNITLIDEEIHDFKKEYKMARGGMVGYMGKMADKIVAHYLPGAEASEVTGRDYKNLGDYNIDTDIEGDGSKNVFINVYFGDKYPAAVSKLQTDYKNYANFLDDLAGKKHFNSEILNNDEDQTILFKFSNPRTSKYEKGGRVKFKDKVKAITKSLTGKPVPQKYRKSAGKVYSKKEAFAAAKRIAGSISKKENK